MLNVPHKPSSTPPFKRRSRSLLLLALLVIAVVFLGGDYTVVHRLSTMETKTKQIAENMLTSVDLVSRMGRDISRERRLIDAHILSSDADALPYIETQIAEAQSDFKRAAESYRPLATLPGERIVWERLLQNEDSIKPPVTELLAISRRNDDFRAREKLEVLEPRFQDIGDDVDELIQINRQGAERQVQDILLLQYSVAELQNILSIAGTAVTLIVGGWAIRLVGQREDQLVENSAILEMRNRDLDAFAGRVAHDLRNPLNTINLASVKLASVCSDDQAVAILQRSVNRMDALIKDMLLLSRAGAEAGDVCDPAKAAAEIRDDLSVRLTREGGTMRVSVAPAKIRGSEGLLRQVLWNLVDNAVKYRRPEVPVHVEVTGRPRREFYELSVSDNGIGMEPNESSKVFEPLYRVPGSRQVPGTGLGLSIVKRVVEASGGTVSVSSKMGQGTAFIINLPIVDDNS